MNTVSPSTPRWYALYTRSCYEQKVAREMELRSLECYFPSYEEVHRWADRKKPVTVPLFRGYLFTRFVDSVEARLAVMNVPGAVRLVGRGLDLEPIPDQDIENIRRLLESRLRVESVPINVSVLTASLGSRVIVRRGSLAGIEGVLERVKGKCRLVLTMPMLGQAATVEIDADKVELLPYQPRLKKGAQHVAELHR